jgi:hypothetical protein
LGLSTESSSVLSLHEAEISIRGKAGKPNLSKGSRHVCINKGLYSNIKSTFI